MKKLYWNDPKTVDVIAKKLQEGKIVGGSSDTVMGLLAPLTRQGFERLNEVKGRQEKPYLILVKDSEAACAFSDAFNGPKLSQIISHYWPGPLTIIVKAYAHVPNYQKAKDGTVAIRVPNHKGLQKLLTHFDGLFSTSANKAGVPTPQTIEEIDPAIADALELLVYDTTPQMIPSTIIDATGPVITLVRQGAIQMSSLESY